MIINLNKLSAKLTHFTGALLIAIFLAVFIYAVVSELAWSNEKVNKTKLTGNEIAKSLNEYNGHNGRYPKSLDSLVPNYIGKILLPSAGNEVWFYDTK